MAFTTTWRITATCSRARESFWSPAMPISVSTKPMLAVGSFIVKKAKLSGSNLEKLSTVVQSALENCRRLEEEPALRGKLRFSGQHVEISVNDRSIALNTGEAFEEIRPEIDFLARRLYSSTNFTLCRNQEDPRQRLNVTLSTPLPFATRTLLKNLQTI